MNDNLITIKNLTKSYGPIIALNNINLEIKRGTVVGLLGPNGCGKTTFIKILANLLTQYEGEILIDGHKPGIETKKIISYLPDRNYLPNNWNVLDAATYFKDFYDDFDYYKAIDMAKRLEIPLNIKFKAMSKGTKEKLQLILVLSRNAKLYLFDEPIAGVDPAARELIFKLILHNYNQEATIIITTHLVYDVQSILEYAIFLKDGVITRYGKVDQMLESTNKTLEELFKEDFRWSGNF
ncbi:MAG TPA: ABC transporter ATP-binding protein [Acholeplasmataceae bacterium]|nr:ABC transporter ATP-binding protein [Acholeplasmataceae bacterium]